MLTIELPLHLYSVIFSWRCLIRHIKYRSKLLRFYRSSTFRWSVYRSNILRFYLQHFFAVFFLKISFWPVPIFPFVDGIIFLLREAVCEKNLRTPTCYHYFHTCQFLHHYYKFFFRPSFLFTACKRQFVIFYNYWYSRKCWKIFPSKQ